MSEVSDVLRDRMHEPAGLQQMAAVSVLLHGALIAVVVMAPGLWLSERAPERPSVMTITLGGGTAGPQDGGKALLGGRAIQTVTPPDAPKRPEPVRPPAAKAPDMTVPRANAPRAGSATTAVNEAPPDARGRTPTRGAETSSGTAVAQTGVRGQGFGLSSGGGVGSGSRLDVADFCCPDYLMLMVEKIRSNWNASAGPRGEAMVVFTIQRDGRITNVSVENPSPNPILNLNAQRALVVTRQLPPLPAAFPNPALTVHLNFQYTR